MTNRAALNEAKQRILAIIAELPTQDLPAFGKDPYDSSSDCLWFKNLSMGWCSASHPESMCSNALEQVFAAEAAGREFARRRDRNKASA